MPPVHAYYGGEQNITSLNSHQNGARNSLSKYETDKEQKLQSLIRVFVCAHVREVLSMFL